MTFKSEKTTLRFKFKNALRLGSFFIHNSQLLIVQEAYISKRQGKVTALGEHYRQKHVSPISLGPVNLKALPFMTIAVYLWERAR